MATTDKTIRDGKVQYWSDGARPELAEVTRKPLSQRNKCQAGGHRDAKGKIMWRLVTWTGRGHGKWGHVCCGCGSLARG